VQEADLHALVVSGVAQDVGDGLRVGEPLARSGPDALIGVDQNGDRLRPALGWLGERGRHETHASQASERRSPPVWTLLCNTCCAALGALQARSGGMSALAFALSSASQSRTSSDGPASSLGGRSPTTARYRTWVFLGLWFLYQLVEANYGLFSASANGGGVAFFAHIGGFLFGVFVARSWPRERLRAAVPRA